jgi:hypothetical protein
VVMSLFSSVIFNLGLFISPFCHVG